MFDVELVKKNSIKKNYGLRKFWSKTMLVLDNFWSKTKLDLKIFGPRQSWP